MDEQDIDSKYIDHLSKVIKCRCLQVEELPPTEYVDYHKIDYYKGQDELTADMQIDQICEQAFDNPTSWKDPESYICRTI